MEDGLGWLGIPVPDHRVRVHARVVFSLGRFLRHGVAGYCFVYVAITVARSFYPDIRLEIDKGRMDSALVLPVWL